MPCPVRTEKDHSDISLILNTSPCAVKDDPGSAEARFRRRDGYKGERLVPAILRPQAPDNLATPR